MLRRLIIAGCSMSYGNNEFHSVHGNTAIIQILGSGDCRYISSTIPSRDRKRVLTTPEELKIAINSKKSAAAPVPFTPTRLFGALVALVHVSCCIGLGCLADSDSLGSSTP